ncbi:hypothetical protein [Komagataeibacter swingsii]|uniref:hypothetical protein n=1 Tax=Komagataeibacter swingsii TaxID=215220 RepID=UPI0011B377DC|nr:hypothetical protein [Komagataeibacter swingsii]
MPIPYRNGPAVVHDHVGIMNGNRISKRLFENKSLIKNNKSFWVPPFSQKGGVLSKLLQKASPKTFFNFKALS